MIMKACFYRINTTYNNNAVCATDNYDITL